MGVNSKHPPPKNLIKMQRLSAIPQCIACASFTPSECIYSKSCVVQKRTKLYAITTFRLFTAEKPSNFAFGVD